MPTFRGLPACDCLVQWLPAYEAELQARGILAPNKALTVYQLIGGAPASAGIHVSGGAFDLLELPGERDLWVARQMGADATWSRRYNWDGRNGMAHIHGVLTGCPHASAGALRQIGAVRANRNGLVGPDGTVNTGPPDDGPRPLSRRTWQQGLAWQRAQAAERAERKRLTLLILTLRAKRAAIKSRIGNLIEKRKAL